MFAFHRRIPVFPASRSEIIEGTAMTGELRHVDSMAGTRQAVRDISHFFRCATKAVDEQDADRSPRKSDAVLDRLRRCRDFVRMFFRLHGTHMVQYRRVLSEKLASAGSVPQSR
jgi:hypothetical protein